MRLLLCFLLLSIQTFAQDTIQQKDSIKLSFHQKSMLFSAVLPGSGQIRNSIEAPHKKAFFEVPLIYAGLGTAGYFLVSNQKTQLSLKQEYTNRQNGAALDPTWAPYDDQAVLQLYRQYLDWRDLSILGFAAIYLFQIAEAGAQAHFVHFDTNPNLSLSLEPQFVPSQYIGARLQLSFR
ncbi:MAG: hypothetical protein RL511_1695 [Bacteroidota bacterium]|jgi:hypothetical protein